MVIEAETQVFDVPNDCLSLSTDCALPRDLLDDEESFVSADLYLIAHRPEYKKAYRGNKESDDSSDDEVEGGGNGAGEKGGDAPAAGGGESGGGGSVTTTGPCFRPDVFVLGCGGRKVGPRVRPRTPQSQISA